MWLRITTETYFYVCPWRWFLKDLMEERTTLNVDCFIIWAGVLDHIKRRRWAKPQHLYFSVSWLWMWSDQSSLAPTTMTPYHDRLSLELGLLLSLSLFCQVHQPMADTALGLLPSRLLWGRPDWLPRWCISLCIFNRFREYLVYTSCFLW